MTDEEHKERHIALHKSFDELFADFISHTSGGPSSPIFDLIEWSHAQTEYPSPDRNQTKEETSGG